MNKCPKCNSKLKKVEKHSKNDKKMFKREILEDKDLLKPIKPMKKRKK